MQIEKILFDLHKGGYWKHKKARAPSHALFDFKSVILSVILNHPSYKVEACFQPLFLSRINNGKPQCNSN